jgi:hypothetical protein
MFSHPDSTAVFRSGVSLDFLGGLFLPHIPHAQLLVPARCHQLGAVGAPGERLYDVGVLETQLRRAALDFPDLDRVVARCAGKDVFGCWVEENMADLPVNCQPAHSVIIRTKATDLMCPARRTEGETSVGSSASLKSVKFSGTFQMNTLPSSDAEAISESLNGLLYSNQRIFLSLCCTAMLPVGVKYG